MARHSDDPYGDFVVRVTNSCRMAVGQAMDMSDDEYYRVSRVLEALRKHIPDHDQCRRATIIIRDLDTNAQT